MGARPFFELLRHLAGFRGEAYLLRQIREGRLDDDLETIADSRGRDPATQLLALRTALLALLDKAFREGRLSEQEKRALAHVLMLEPSSARRNAGQRRGDAAIEVGYSSGSGFRSHMEEELLLALAGVFSPRKPLDATLPTGIRSDQTYELPAVPALLFVRSLGAEADHTNADDAIARWLEDDSNLLVILGSFGSGKTTSLHRCQERAEQAGLTVTQTDFERITQPDPAVGPSDVVLIDNVDSPVAVDTKRIEAQDLRFLRPWLTGESKIGLASRRQREDFASDEMLRQLLNARRLSALGVRKVYVLDLQSWTWTTMEAWCADRNEFGRQRLAASLASEEAGGVLMPCTPMTVTMAFDLETARPSRVPPDNSFELYHDYCDMALSADYDAARSAVPGHVKLRILTDVADDIFFGRDVERAAPRISISHIRLNERILQNVMQDVPLAATRQNDYGWTADFGGTNHLIDRLRHRGEIPRWGFRHGSFYEYFVALALARRVRNGKTFGLSIETIAHSTFESLIMPFLKAALDEEMIESLLEMAGRPRLGWLDRLLILSLLEESEDYFRVLTSAPDEYFNELERLGVRATHFFVGKMALFQLVIAARVPASEYIRVISIGEDRPGIEAERRLHGTRNESTTDVLLRRLRNPGLARAIPIALFRLGQLGDESALNHLVAFAEAHPEFGSGCRAAEHQIRARAAEAGARR